MNRLVYLKSLFTLIFFFYSLNAIAEKEETLEQKFIQNNISISNWLDRMAEKIDLYLVGKKVSTQKNNTQIKLQNSSFSTEGQPIVNTFSISINPRFPNLEEFLQLKFTSTDDKENNRKVVSANLNDNQTEKKYTNSGSLFEKLGRVKVAFQPRVTLQNPIKLSHSLLFEFVDQYKLFNFNPKLELFADADKGAGFYNAFNFHFELTKIYSLSLINDGEYLEKPHMYTVNNGLAIGQVYSNQVYFSYSLIFTSNNRDQYHLESYVFAFSYEQQIYKKILDFQVIPQLEFQKKNKFKGMAGVRLNLNLNF